MRVCSSKRPTTERTVTLSLMPGTPGRKQPDSPHDQIDFDARLGRSIKGLNQDRITD